MSSGRKDLLFEAAAPVRATTAQLRELIDGAWLVRRLRWDVPIDPGPWSGPGVGRAPGMISLQGGWWYRGEYTAEERGGRTHLVHRVFNVAPQGRWAPALANRLFLGYRATLQRATTDLARQVDEELGR